MRTIDFVSLRQHSYRRLMRHSFFATPFNASTYLVVAEVTKVVTHVGFTKIAGSSNVLSY